MLTEVSLQTLLSGTAPIPCRSESWVALCAGVSVVSGDVVRCESICGSSPNPYVEVGFGRLSALIWAVGVSANVTALDGGKDIHCAGERVPTEVLFPLSYEWDSVEVARAHW